MNKAQLTEALAQRLGGDRRVAAEAVESTIDIIVRTVESGENVTITGFGVFEKRSRAARVARNPRTGATVMVAPTSVPSFRPGTNFKSVVSGEAPLNSGTPAVRRTSAPRAASSSTASAAPATTVAKPKKAAEKKVAAKKAPEKKAVAKKVSEKKAGEKKSSDKKAPATKPAKAGKQDKRPSKQPKKNAKK